MGYPYPNCCLCAFGGAPWFMAKKVRFLDSGLQARGLTHGSECPQADPKSSQLVLSVTCRVSTTTNHHDQPLLLLAFPPSFYSVIANLSL